MSRAETPRDRRDREALAEDVRSAGPPRPAAAASAPQLPARRRTGTSPRSAARSRTWSGSATITELTAEHERRLARGLGGARSRRALDDDAFAAAWRAEVEAWSFDEVNDLIDRHNRFYPAESRLPMDPRTRDYALVGGEDYRRRPLDAAWALERFPALAGRADARSPV